MAEKKSASKPTKKAARSTSGKSGLSAGERAALRDLVQERRGKGEGESAVLEAIAAMPVADRTIGERLHAIVKANAPILSPKTWYGMPAYAKDGKVVFFYKPASKFKARYATIGFEDHANLDEGAMWPTSYALTKLTAADEAKIGALVKKAAR